MAGAARERVERRARWVLDTLGAREVAVADVGVRADAWAAVERGERPDGDELADAFFHLARVEEREGTRDAHGRFTASASCLDPLDAPLERLRARLGLEPPRWRGARFAIALTHDVDSLWKWTRIGVRGALARLRADVRRRDLAGARHETRALAAQPLHKLRRGDPNGRFRDIAEGGGEPEATSTVVVLA
ncbi:MAG: hypothetical protein ICV64_04400, partial [Thermoleophilia bacterium]|nr:hypothetical protein [Thermoleophilia bacterium]